MTSGAISSLRSPRSLFKHFLALAPEDDKMSSRRLDLSILWPWLEKSSKYLPGDPIWAFSGFGSGSRQNEVQELRFKHFIALAPEVVKMSSRGSDLSISGAIN